MDLEQSIGTYRGHGQSERAMIMRNQGFIHPATLVPDELEYNKGYEARMDKLNQKFTSNTNNKETEKSLEGNKKN